MKKEKSLKSLFEEMNDSINEFWSSPLLGTGKTIGNLFGKHTKEEKKEIVDYANSISKTYD